jgi:PhoPQ-activated pathogenicity-related protein
MKNWYFRLCLIVLISVSSCFADLKSYVEKSDPAYQYQVVQKQQLGSADVSIIQFTSLIWENKPWQHWLYLLKPKQILHPGKAVLVIMGGSNRSGIPKLPKEAMIIGMACQQLGVPVAVLGQVPNQPLYDNLKEDNLIAHTMTMFLESGNEEQVLLMPMVKSAVRAMDCVSDLMEQSTGTPINQFVVSGGSKRGWTTYLTAAVDKRVIAAAPLVIDMLKLPAQMDKQRQVYGEHLSPKIKPYTSRGVLDHLDSERGKKLVQLIDPYAYRQLLTMPKLLLLGTNDPFWTVDAANLYFGDLPGTTYLYYVPNAGHGLDLAALPTLLSFFKASVSGKQLARFDWKQNDDGSTTVKCKDKPVRLELIQSNNPTMDFREAQWVSKPIPPKTDAIHIKPDMPAEGYLAYYIKATFPSINQLPYALSTQITVLGGR